MVSDTVRHGAYGGAVVFLIALIAAVPLFGLFLGPLFTLGGGLVGGAVAGYLHERGVSGGIKTGTIAGVGGGIVSAIIGTALGTFLNVLITMDGGDPQVAGWMYMAVFGIVSGLLFTSFGGMVGGIFGGAVAGDKKEFERPDQRGRHRIDPSSDPTDRQHRIGGSQQGSASNQGVHGGSTDQAVANEGSNPWLGADELPSGSETQSEADEQPQQERAADRSRRQSRDRRQEPDRWSDDDDDDPEWERIS